MTRLLAALLALCLAAAAQAQTFPAKPITIVLSYAAGGPTDFLARTLAEKVSARVGQPVLVDPKPGANERVATSYLLGQPSDGYNIVLVAVPHATNPAVFAQMPYDSTKEFTGLIHLVSIPPILTVRADSPIKNFNDFVALAKSKPGAATYGSSGNATNSHLTLELLATLSGASFLHIPYKGDTPALTDLLGGQIVGSVNALPAAIPQIKGGRVRGIGISSQERHPLVPEVPTFVEQGYKDAVSATWFGLILRSSVPRDVVAKLSAEFNAALAMPDVREKLAERGMLIVGGSPEQFTAHIRREYERWSAIIKARGIKVD